MTRRLNSWVTELVVTKPNRLRREPLAASSAAARSHQYITKSTDLLTRHRPGPGDGGIEAMPSAHGLCFSRESLAEVRQFQ